MTTLPRIVIAAGDPAGIGPDLVIQLAQQSWPADIVVVSDPKLLLDRARLLNLSLELIPFFVNDYTAHQPQTIKVIPIKLDTPCTPGELTSKNANYVLNCLAKATELCLQKKAQALVTGPVHKGTINEGGFHFSGHTEYLAKLCRIKKSLMLFVTPQTKVALATTHLPLEQVPSAITPELIETALQILQHYLIQYFDIAEPRISVCGLNPHAGENGYLGRQEIDIINPTLHRLRHAGMNLIGPLPADSIFTPDQLNAADAVLAMYHDQALPTVKYMSFGQAVNVTLGLPIIRTSVDHGTAVTLAGTGKANAESMKSALQLAIELALRTQTT